GGSIINVATATSDQLDLDPLSNTAQTTTTVQVPLSAHLSIATLPNNAFQISLTADPSQSYQLQASSNLLNWTTLQVRTAAANGTLKFTNSAASDYRFYRSTRLP